MRFVKRSPGTSLCLFDLLFHLELNRKFNCQHNVFNNSFILDLFFANWFLSLYYFIWWMSFIHIYVYGLKILFIVQWKVILIHFYSQELWGNVKWWSVFQLLVLFVMFVCGDVNDYYLIVRCQSSWWPSWVNILDMYEQKFNFLLHLALQCLNLPAVRRCRRFPGPRESRPSEWLADRLCLQRNKRFRHRQNNG